jgi:hypothetical protein
MLHEMFQDGCVDDETLRGLSDSEDERAQGSLFAQMSQQGSLSQTLSS